MSGGGFLNGERVCELWERTKSEIDAHIPGTATDEEVAEMLDEVFLHGNMKKEIGSWLSI